MFASMKAATLGEMMGTTFRNSHLLDLGDDAADELSKGQALRRAYDRAAERRREAGLQAENDRLRRELAEERAHHAETSAQLRALGQPDR